MSGGSLQEQLRALRLRDCFAQARELLRTQPGFETDHGLKRLCYEHEDFWWNPIVGRRVTLQRRAPQDAPFVRACWADDDFMRKFNRVARPLPSEDSELQAILARERAGLFSEAKALHWTIHQGGAPIGFISVTDYAPGHRRAEFLIGILHKPASFGPVEAAHLAVRFLEEKAGIERLTAYFYAENTYAAKVAEKFGFEREGVLMGYIRDGAGKRSDLIVAGMLLGQHSSQRWQSTRERVIRGAAAPDAACTPVAR